MLAVLPEWGMGGLHYRLLTLAEPYIVAVLKAGRILKERFGKE